MDVKFSGLPALMSHVAAIRRLEMGHSSAEHRLRADIAERHGLRNEIEEKQSLIARLNEKLEKVKKKRLNNRYSTTIRRFNTEIKDLEYRLNELNLDLQKRIMDEMKFSEEEIRSFTEQYQKERAEMEETEGKLEAIEEGTMEDDAEETPEKASVPKEAIVARTRRMLDRERKVVEKIQREISSEERDKVLFASELQQIAAELKAYGQD